MAEQCVFCKIAKDSSRASAVYEDDFVLAFLDNRPASDGHTLVIPKKHYRTIYDIPDDEVAHLFKIVKRAAIAMRQTMDPEGLTVVQRNGALPCPDIGVKWF
jgi:histidine triad (HIT) family protein